MFQRLWKDDAGFTVASELTLVASILVLGMLVGLVSVRDQVVQELGDLAAAVSSTNQSFSFAGITGHTSSSAGSVLDDQADNCDGFFSNDPEGEAPMCIDLFVVPEPEGGP